MGYVVSWFRAKVLDNGMWFFWLLLALFLIVLIPSVDNVSERLGFDTKTTLRVELAEKQNVLLALGQEVADLKRDLEYQRTITEAWRATLESYQSEVREVEEVIIKSDTAMEKEINEIRRDESLEPSVRDTRVATTQIASLWDVFCELGETNCD